MKIIPPELRTSGSKLKPSGFSLVEVLVTIAIIAVLIVISAVAIGKVIAKARSSQCLAQMRQVGASILAYAGEHDGILPTQKSEGAWYRDSTSWSGKIFPYAGQFEIMACPEYTKGAPANSTAPYPPKVTYYYNPYVATAMMPESEGIRVARSHNPSKDILVIDNRSNPRGMAMVPGLAAPSVDPKTMPWLYPHPGVNSASPFRSVLFLDGHVEMRTNDISYVYWQWPLQ